MKKPTVEQTEEALRIIEKATTEEVGQRCPDYEPYCVVCEAWLHFDGVKRTVHSYIDTLENYEDPSDYVGMGWVLLLVVDFLRSLVLLVHPQMWLF